MSTRSFITVKLGPSTKNVGLYATIYCHSDGYASRNGVILAEHYNDQKLAEALVRGGDLSVLAPNCGKPPAGHSFEHKVPGFCVYYGRDRGEKGTRARITATLQEAWDTVNPGPHREIHYFWNGRAWTMLQEPKEPVQISIPEALAQEARADAEWAHLRNLRDAKEAELNAAVQTELQAARRTRVSLHQYQAIRARLDRDLDAALQQLRNGDLDAELLAKTPFPG